MRIPTRHVVVFACIALALAIGGRRLVVAPRAQAPAYDIVIRNGRIVDGTGSPWYRADHRRSAATRSCGSRRASRRRRRG